MNYCELLEQEFHPEADISAIHYYEQFGKEPNPECTERRIALHYTNSEIEEVLGEMSWDKEVDDTGTDIIKDTTEELYK